LTVTLRNKIPLTFRAHTADSLTKSSSGVNINNVREKKNTFYTCETRTGYSNNIVTTTCCPVPRDMADILKKTSDLSEVTVETSVTINLPTRLNDPDDLNQ
jgi:hypothetical protein